MINKHNIQEYILLDADGELTAKQHAELKIYLQSNPQAAEQWQALQATKLQADANLVVKNKMNLYAIANQQTAIKKSTIPYLKIAASVALLMGMFVTYKWYSKSELITTNVAANSQINTVVPTSPVTYPTPIDSDKQDVQIVYHASIINKQTNPVEKRKIVIVPHQNTEKKSQVAIVIPTSENNQEAIALEKLETAKATYSFNNPNSNVAVKAITVAPVAIQNLPINANSLQTKNPITIAFAEPDFLNQNKAYQFFKKANQKIMALAAESKNFKQNGMDIDIEVPTIFKKNNY